MWRSRRIDTGNDHSFPGAHCPRQHNLPAGRSRDGWSDLGQVSPKVLTRGSINAPQRHKAGLGAPQSSRDGETEQQPRLQGRLRNPAHLNARLTCALVPRSWWVPQGGCSGPQKRIRLSALPWDTPVPSVLLGKWFPWVGSS